MSDPKVVVELLEHPERKPLRVMVKVEPAPEPKTVTIPVKVKPLNREDFKAQSLENAMKHLLTYVLVLAYLAIANPAGAQDSPMHRQLAVEGDTVWVIMNPIKADKRDQFERFVSEIFWPEAQRLSEEEQHAFRQTRVLYPTAPEEDGTYTYFFIMDPFIPGADYSIFNFLVKMYGQEEAQEHMKLLDEAFAGPQQQYKVVQSKY